jgi:hypothetical protein
MAKGREHALDVLQKVFTKNTTKGLKLSANGSQIRREKDNEVICAICKYAAKVTMPVKGDDCRPCEGNKHMTWIQFDSPRLKELFENRIAEPKTMLQFEHEAYGGPSPARAKAQRQTTSGTPEGRLENATAKLERAKAEVTQAKKDIQAVKKADKKASKAKPKAKAKAASESA